MPGITGPGSLIWSVSCGIGARMKIRRVVALAGSLVAVAVAACVALTAYWQRQQPVLKDGSKLIAAVQAFSRDKTTGGEALPASVSLRELVSGGYIAASDVRAFDGMEVTISLAADETRPQETLIRVRLPDGTVIAGLTDGSAQQIRK